jgi:ATP-dependent exoDNAse (exonuclease V) beta subunit
MNSILSQLECFNDTDFKFDPKLHKYTYHNEQFVSVTQYIQNFHKPFESDFWSKKKADQRGVDQEVILKEWKQLNDYANEVGTDTHQWIEDYFNQIWKPIPSNLDLVHRINKFNKVFAKHLHKLEPIKFEVRIFSKKWKIAGMIDSLFFYKGKLFILDWKTNKQFTHDNHQKGQYEKLLEPFDQYWANHLNEYSIQLSLYALILEEWGFEVGGGYLVHIGPNEEEAQLFKIIDMRDNLKIALKKRENESI